MGFGKRRASGPAVAGRHRPRHGGGAAGALCPFAAARRRGWQTAVAAAALLAAAPALADVAPAAASGIAASAPAASGSGPVAAPVDELQPWTAQPVARPHGQAALAPVAEAAATAHGLPGEFFKRLIRQESGFNPEAVSRAGAQGVAQFMPATAARMGLDDPFDPLKALPKSAELLAELKRRFGNLGLAAAAYNAGEARVQAWLDGRGGLPLETQDYVRAITGKAAHEWAPAHLVERLALRAQASLAIGHAVGGGRFSLAPYGKPTGEWGLGRSLPGTDPKLVALLDTVGRAGARASRRRAGAPPVAVEPIPIALAAEPAQPLAIAAFAAPTPARRAGHGAGERSLCQSLGGGCIIRGSY